LIVSFSTCRRRRSTTRDPVDAVVDEREVEYLVVAAVDGDRLALSELMMKRESPAHPLQVARISCRR
jgi:hypothetical protein